MIAGRPTWAARFDLPTQPATPWGPRQPCTNQPIPMHHSAISIKAFPGVAVFISCRPSDALRKAVGRELNETNVATGGLRRPDFNCLGTYISNMRLIYKYIYIYIFSKYVVFILMPYRLVESQLQIRSYVKKCCRSRGTGPPPQGSSLHCLAYPNSTMLRVRITELGIPTRPPARCLGISGEVGSDRRGEEGLVGWLVMGNG